MGKMSVEVMSSWNTCVDIAFFQLPAIAHICSHFFSTNNSCMYMCRQFIFLGKVTALGVLCCFALFVCLTLVASLFLPSHLSLKTCTYMNT